MPPRTAASRLPLLFGAAVLLTAAGCGTVESTSGDFTTYNYPWYTSILALVWGFVLAGAGYFCRDYPRLCLGLTGSGVFFAVSAAPTYFLATAKVSPERFVVRSGFFPLMSYQEFKYEELGMIRITSMPGRRRSSAPSFTLECHLNVGDEPEVVKVRLGALGEQAAPLILAVAQSRGVPVIDATKELPAGINRQ